LDEVGGEVSNPWESHGIDHLSASQINLFCSSPALWVMEKILKKRSRVGCAAHRGNAAETGIVAGLLNPNKPIEECIEEANAQFRRLAALSSDPNKEKEGKSVPLIVAQGIRELRPYGVPSSVQGKIEHRFDDLSIPVVGYYDVAWDKHGILLDIKTQLRLASQIKTGHARQVALYKAALSDNLDTRVSYITDKKAATYSLENYKDHLSALHRIALTMQRFVSLSKDGAELAGLVVPDCDTFYFNDAVTRQNAWETWQI
jgi:hypothetical protein